MGTNSEIWKPVVGWEEWYGVSDQGKVRSVDRWIKYSDGRKRFYLGQILCQSLNGAEYFSVTLYRDRNRKVVCVHTLVCEAFIGPRPEGCVVCHGEEGKLQNRLENLKYATESENHFDQYRDGTMTNAKQIKCSDGKIYRSIRQAERDTGISNQNIVHVLKGQQKTAGGFHWEYV